MKSKLIAYNGNNKRYRNVFGIFNVKSISKEKNNNYKYYLSDDPIDKLKSYNFKIINQSDIQKALANISDDETSKLERNLDELWFLKFLDKKKKHNISVFENYCITDKKNPENSSDVVFDDHKILFDNFTGNQSLFDFSYYE